MPRAESSQESGWGLVWILQRTERFVALLHPRIKSEFLRRPSHSLVTIQTTLSCMLGTWLMLATFNCQVCFVKDARRWNSQKICLVVCHSSLHVLVLKPGMQGGGTTFPFTSGLTYSVTLIGLEEYSLFQFLLFPKVKGGGTRLVPSAYWSTPGHCPLLVTNMFPT
jgi:hypothetical protein